MREILFKAKIIDNGEWVEGFYFCMVHDDGRHIHHFIMPIGCDLSLGTPIEKIQVEIDIDTLCQYTGLTDKNGCKIWENDVVFDDEICSSVRWDELSARFVIVDWDEDGGVVDTNGFDDFCDDANVIFEVIGNIFDNPELLEGGD